LKCKLCGRVSPRLSGFGCHLAKTHGVTLREYATTTIGLRPALCACGCGEEVLLRRLTCAKVINGHQRKGKKGGWGNVGWSKGLTKETHPGLAASAEKHLGNTWGKRGWFKPGVGPQMSPEVEVERRRKIGIWSKAHNSMRYPAVAKRCATSFRRALREGRVRFSMRTGSGKTGFRSDLGQSFRSTWEANFARVLNLLKISWKYEYSPKPITRVMYRPDFYLPDRDIFVEVKGYPSPKFRRRLPVLQRALGGRLFVLDPNCYEVLRDVYSAKLSLWEA